MDVTGIIDAPVQARALSGPITLSDVRNVHLDVFSLSGNVRLQSVVGSSVTAHSGSGRITYEGDPGTEGEYVLTSHSGDPELSIPASGPGGHQGTLRKMIRETNERSTLHFPCDPNVQTAM